MALHCLYAPPPFHCIHVNKKLHNHLAFFQKPPSHLPLTSTYKTTKKYREATFRSIQHKKEKNFKKKSLSFKGQDLKTTCFHHRSTLFILCDKSTLFILCHRSISFILCYRSTLLILYK